MFSPPTRQLPYPLHFCHHRFSRIECSCHIIILQARLIHANCSNPSAVLSALSVHDWNIAPFAEQLSSMCSDDSISLQLLQSDFFHLSKIDSIFCTVLSSPRFRPESFLTWSISPPNRDQIVSGLNETSNKVTVVLSVTLERNASLSSDRLALLPSITVVSTTVLSAAQRNLMIRSVIDADAPVYIPGSFHSLLESGQSQSLLFQGISPHSPSQSDVLFELFSEFGRITR